MKVNFPYEEKRSFIFKKILRPVARVRFWSSRYDRWIEYTMIVDTGADYTLLPFSKARDLGIDLERDCKKLESLGIGGKELVYFSKEKIKVMIAAYGLMIPLGFLSRDDIPPLLGREECLNDLDVLFSNFVTSFSSKI